ncbi:MAG: hypothetical protein J5972_01410 [Eubacterium sp.]|nr:hypothetical protein [Eubacterium sp.]
MFGYVKVNEPELKIREYDRYKGFYCGLCRSLKEAHGRLGQLTLTYDMTFLVLLLSSLYEPRTSEKKKRCMIHPTSKRTMLQNEISRYAADMNVLLTEEHLSDDWEDERKCVAFLGMKMYACKKKKIEQKYERQSQAIRRALQRLHELEKQNVQEPEVAAVPFGDLMAELFVYREDAFQHILRPLGFYLGQYVYILDAYLDVEEDVKKTCYNPFAKSYQDTDFDEKVKELLEHTIQMAIVEFEKLPLEQDLAILRNILYEGVWIEYERKRRNDRSV